MQIAVKLRDEPEGFQPLDLPSAFTPGTKLYRVYVRIRTATYRVRNGLSYPSFDTHSSKEQWEAVCAEIAGNCGLVEERGFWLLPGSPATRVHFHPDAIAGEMEQDLVARLEEQVAQYPDLLTYQSTDIFDRAGELVDEAEVDKRFDHYAHTLRDRMLAAYATRSANRYTTADTKRLLSQLPGLQFAKTYEGFLPNDRLFQRIDQLLDELVEEGELIKHPFKDGFYRKRLQREAKAAR